MTLRRSRIGLESRAVAVSRAGLTTSLAQPFDCFSVPLVDKVAALSNGPERSFESKFTKRIDRVPHLLCHCYCLAVTEHWKTG